MERSIVSFPTGSMFMIKKCFLLLLCFVAPTSLLWAMDTFIQGKAIGYEGKMLTLYQYDDPLSEAITVLDEVLISRNGDFNSKLNIESTRKVFLRVSWTTAVMYLKPGYSYEVVFPDPVEGGFRAMHKAAFVELEFNNLAMDDPNYRIAQFNNYYDSFFAKNYVEIAKSKYPGADRFKESRKDELASLLFRNDSLSTAAIYEGLSFSEMVMAFRDEVMDRFRNDEDYIRNYVKYALAQMELKSGISRIKVFERYFTEGELPYLHPEFVLSAEQLYYRFFDDLRSEFEIKGFYRSISEHQSLDSLEKDIELSPFAVNENLKELATYYGLLDLRVKKSLKAKNLERVINQLVDRTSQGWIKKVREGEKKEFAPRTNNVEVEQCQLLNTAEERTDWNTFEGKVCYVLVMATWCSACLEELSILESYSRKYGRDVEFVILSMDENYEEFKTFVGRYHRNNWTFIYGMSDPFLREKMNMWSVPDFFMLDPQGKYLQAHATPPSRGLEKELKNLTKGDYNEYRIKNPGR